MDKTLQTWLQLFLTFTKIGILGYGGGPAMIPLIQEEVVDGRGWMTDEEFMDTLAMGNTLPGPIATKMTLFIGYQVAGLAGGLWALFSMLWPSLTLMMVLGLFFLRFKDMPYAKAMLKAVRPVVVALLAYTTYTVIPKAIDVKDWRAGWHTGLIAVVAFVVVTFLNLHPALVILGAAVLGLVVYR
jgi:chromate transporter